MADLERKYIIPLRKQWLKVPYYKRTKKAIKAIREFSIKHMKAEEVKIGTFLNEFVHRHGRKNPPHKVEVLMKKPENQNYVEVELPDAPKKEEVKKEKTTIDKIKEKIPGRKETIEEKVETPKEKEEETKKEVLESPKIVKKQPVEEVPKAEELAKKQREQIPKINGKQKDRI